MNSTVSSEVIALSHDVQKPAENLRGPLLIIRLMTLMIMVVLLTLHVRSLRVFRWEQSVSGGLLVTYCIASLGLALCAGATKCGGPAFQAYICGVGTALLAVNAVILYQRWRYAGELTRVVAEFLVAMGVPLRRQVLTKVVLSAAAATTLLADLVATPLLTRSRSE
ncbi:unnamed protein product [Pieris brassicae]|uniref:Uncharacterized protein n=1 Tax=Pieris brassicae TaxID=7116 RepID=A0A9P0XJN3_PIEBR|nr:unnamed protein product [Pieris brassicae]